MRDSSPDTAIAEIMNASTMYSRLLPVLTAATAIRKISPM